MMNNVQQEIKTLRKDMSLGEIASIYPGAINFFMDFEIDFCCGGNRALEEALQEANLNTSAVLEKIRKQYRIDMEQGNKMKNFHELSKSALIEYIVETHHEYLRKNLPRIESLTETIFRVHGKNHYEMLQFVNENVKKLKKELEAHLEKEETVLFPKVLEFEKGTLDKEALTKTIDELENEHDAAGHILKGLRRMTKGYRVPDDGCNTFVFAFDKLEELEKDLFQHIHLENNILFKL